VSVVTTVTMNIEITTIVFTTAIVAMTYVPSSVTPISLQQEPFSSSAFVWTSPFLSQCFSPQPNESNFIPCLGASPPSCSSPRLTMCANPCPHRSHQSSCSCATLFLSHYAHVPAPEVSVKVLEETLPYFLKPIPAVHDDDDVVEAVFTHQPHPQHPNIHIFANIIFFRDVIPS
jgi:hypothetical protein